MPYEINKSNDSGSSISVADGAIDTTSLSIPLFGRGYDGLGAGTGEQQQQALLWVMESFAHTSPPLNPIMGQTWFDPSTESYNVYESTGNWRDLNDFYDSSIFDIAISDDAQIQLKKLVDGTAGDIIVVDSLGTPAYLQMNGDIFIDQFGTTSIQSNTVNTAEIASGVYINALQLDASIINATVVTFDDTNITTSLDMATAAVLTVTDVLDIVSPTANLTIGSPNNLSTIYTTSTPKHLFNNDIELAGDILITNRLSISYTPPAFPVAATMGFVADPGIEFKFETLNPLFPLAPKEFLMTEDGDFVTEKIFLTSPTTTATQAQSFGIRVSGDDELFFQTPSDTRTSLDVYSKSESDSINAGLTPPSSLNNYQFATPNIPAAGNTTIYSIPSGPTLVVGDMIFISTSLSIKSTASAMIDVFWQSAGGAVLEGDFLNKITGGGSVIGHATLGTRIAFSGWFRASSAGLLNISLIGTAKINAMTAYETSFVQITVFKV